MGWGHAGVHLPVLLGLWGQQEPLWLGQEFSIPCPHRFFPQSLLFLLNLKQPFFRLDQPFSQCQVQEKDVCGGGVWNTPNLRQLQGYPTG